MGNPEVSTLNPVTLVFPHRTRNLGNWYIVRKERSAIRIRERLRNMEHHTSESRHVSDTGEQETVLARKRQKFLDDYCRKLGWDPKQLSFEQTLEIREQDGWKNPK